MAIPNETGDFLNILATALVAILSTFCTVLFQNFFSRRRERAQKEELFRNYAAPLIRCSENIIWRFGEIILDKRMYLTVDHDFVHVQYKRTSSLYRIASLLGWLRAIQLELDALPRKPDAFPGVISVAIEGIRSALADGPQAEQRRLERLCEIWEIDIKEIDALNRKEIIIDIDIKIHEALIRHESKHIDRLQSLSTQEKNMICRSIYGSIISKLRSHSKPYHMLQDRTDRAIKIIADVESLIYRDWQEAIGDIMLAPDHNSTRRFRIISYSDFEKILYNNSIWMNVFRDSLNGIGVQHNGKDARIEQLVAFARSIAHLLISIEKTSEKDLINANALLVAKRLWNISFDPRQLTSNDRPANPAAFKTTNEPPSLSRDRHP
ncbi:hypothetical protein P7L68_09550 [Tistrella mobilis]|uniref:hypothetical protein n=1 Tax=Tistrella mobilis TaxID=171437 RepID=UPI003556BF0C